jgi:hypothetical protein
MSIISTQSTGLPCYMGQDLVFGGNLESALTPYSVNGLLIISSSVHLFASQLLFTGIHTFLPSNPSLPTQVSNIKSRWVVDVHAPAQRLNEPPAPSPMFELAHRERWRAATLVCIDTCRPHILKPLQLYNLNAVCKSNDHN